MTQVKAKKYGGRVFSSEELTLIQHLVKEMPTLNRAALSRLVCERLNWRKPDGGLKDMRCRVAMIEMDRAGFIQLPAPRNKSPGMIKKKIILTEATKEQPDQVLPVHQLGEIVLTPVLDRASARLWNEFIERYHYLGHKTLPGAQMRYIVKADGRIIALFGFGAAAWRTAARDQFIGWTPEAREKNLYRVVNNARFLILPWIQSKNLASKLLALAAKQLRLDWSKRYGYTPVLLETFVEIPRFTGGCYRAANWICVGKTTGLGRNSTSKVATLPQKTVWLYPLNRDFKAILCHLPETPL